MRMRIVNDKNIIKYGYLKGDLVNVVKIYGFYIINSTLAIRIEDAEDCFERV